MVELRCFTEKEYHQFFKGYVSDPLMDPVPFVYNKEQISRSYAYNHGGYRENYAHFGIFLDDSPVGSLQLKRMDFEKGTVEVGIILRDDSVKNRGIGTEAVRQAILVARDHYRLDRMLGDTMGRNARMIRVFEKLGFTLVERVSGGFELSDGSRQDRLVYAKSLTEA